MRPSSAFQLFSSLRDAIATSRRLFFLLIVAFCFNLAQPFAAVAQTSIPAALPPPALEALDKGIIAARVPDYLLAIRYFEEARKLAPQAPGVLLNMGLAESKISGRELRAMAWFGAYMAAYPDAPNGAAVKEQIAVLDVRYQSTISRLVRGMEDAANQIPKSKIWLEDQWFMPDERRDNLLKVAELWQNIGDFPSALRTASSISSDFYKAGLQADVGFAQIKAGDNNGARQTFTVAMQTAGRLHAGRHASNKVLNIAIGHARTGDVVGALQSVDSLKDDALKSQAQFNIALHQVGAGDVEGSRKTFELADQTVERVRDPDTKNEIRLFFAKEKKGIGAGNAFSATGQTTSTPLNQPAVAVSNWLNKLDDDNSRSDCPLNTSPFLDLAGHLKTFSSGDAKKIFDGMFDAAETIAKAKNVVAGMLKQQAQK